MALEEEKKGKVRGEGGWTGGSSQTQKKWRVKVEGIERRGEVERI
jgi:hypothetical protein